MNKLKIYIIIFCLVLSTFFINITSTYCVNYFTYSLFFYPVEGYEDSYINPTVSLTRSGVTETYDLSFDDINNIYYVDVSLATNSSYSYDFYSNGELIENGTLMGSTNKYIYIYLTKYPSSIEDTESTESTESTENITQNVTVDMTETNNKLNNIYDLLLMFFALFTFYFGYKIVKEIVFNVIERK